MAAGAIAQTPAAATAPQSWKTAAPGRRLAFPADHASHPGYKLEWWYYTGNLGTDDGRRFGYQLTFFRVGVNPAPANRSLWAVRDLFMAHLAVTDINGRRYLFTERLNRAGPGWAGADTDRLHVWNEDWEATIEKGQVHVLRATAIASEGGRRFGVDLRLEEDRPPVLHGDRGYQPQRIRSRQRLALLLAAAHADQRDAVDRRPRRGGDRPQLDGSRVRHQLSRAGAARVGLALRSNSRTAAA